MKTLYDRLTPEQQKMVILSNNPRVIDDLTNNYSFMNTTVSTMMHCAILFGILPNFMDYSKLFQPL